MKQTRKQKKAKLRHKAYKKIHNIVHNNLPPMVKRLAMPITMERVRNIQKFEAIQKEKARKAKKISK